MRSLALTGVGLLLAVSALFGAREGAAAPQACNVKPGSAIGATWPQQRLNFQQAWSVTRGQGVLVAVIDTGVNTTLADGQGNPQLRHIRTIPGVNVLGGAGQAQADTRDCDGHGTAVTGIIAAQPIDGLPFTGVAPDATILPIKQTNTRDDKTGNIHTLARAIQTAVARHAAVANISVTVPKPDAELVAAVQHAQAQGMVIVAAAGNDGSTTTQRAYPAAFSTRFDNVIAVSAVDIQDAVAKFSDAGRFVTVAAPGVNVPAPSSNDGFMNLEGTSFAAPYVTGTVALMLAANPSMTPSQVRSRLETTADPPPTAVPSRTYGYGVVNPYLAVTAIRDDGGALPSAARAAPIPAPQPPRAADHHLQHVALGAATVLLGLAALTVAGAVALKGPRRRPASS